MNGKATPWEEMEDDEEPLDDLEMETEMEQITLDITELVDCLLRLSVSIQNPAPHDRFMSSTFTDASAYEDFDIQHVQAKFQDIDEGLAQRLGKAMSRRRQYFKYREAHHQKLSHDNDEENTVKRTYATYLLEYQDDLAKAKVPHAKIPEGFDSGKNVEALFSTSEKNAAIYRTSSDVESSHSIEFSGDIPAEDGHAFNSVGRGTDIDTSLQKANIVRDLAEQNGREAEEDENIENVTSYESSHDAQAIDDFEPKQIKPAARRSPNQSALGIMSPSSLFDKKSTAFGADVLDYFVSSERRSQEHGQALERNRPSSAMGIITTSQSLSASASYEEPSWKDFREKSDFPTNDEKQFNSVIPSLQRQHSFDSDKGKRLAQETLRRASDDSSGIDIGTSRGFTEDRLNSLSIDAGPGNKRRASSPPDADNVLDSASLKSEPVTSETKAGSSQVPSAEALGEDTEADDKRTKAKVLYDFIGKTPNELTVESNDLVDILHQGDKGFRSHNHSEILMMQALSSP
ncbi:hypothetical protein KNSL1_001978 [Colletotrichum chrysophilum]|nr:hypothetical protein KNSL1_001978 [Colletotrichum chrysophilum]